MATINPPDDFDAAVKVLPDGQDPFGAACDLSRDLQNFLFHYTLGQAEADLLVQEDNKTLRDVRVANPDGDHEEKMFYEWSIHSAIPRRKTQVYTVNERSPGFRYGHFVVLVLKAGFIHWRRC